jgi:outer membrane protein OmpA-like peptidoglycan-associated protein
VFRICARLDAMALLVLAALCVGAASLGLSSAAHAQAPEGIDPQLFVLPAGGGTTFTIDRPTVPRHLSVVAGLGLHYAHAPLVRANADGTTTPVVGGLAQADALFAIGFFEWVELGVAMPLVVGEVARDALAADVSRAWQLAPGDLRLSAKVPLVRGDFALAARGVFTLPTGDSKDFFGAPYWTATPSLVAAWTRGALGLAGELGYRLRRRTALGALEHDDEVQLSLGATWALGAQLSLIAESQLRVGLGGRTPAAGESPMEVDVGVRWRVGAFSIEAGAGTGVLAGYGAPSARGFTALRYRSERTPCAAGPEDFDGFEDGDFCADLDNDADRVPDAADECPNDAEDRDGFLDADGCPDPDDDADGALDARDACARVSEDRDGFRDDDGCPETDNDGDGLADGLDECPMEPEDRDQFQDDDGCPEPGPRAATVTVTDTRILISERIYFDFDRDTIRSVSMPLLDQVAAVMADIPAGRGVRVEGYSDDQGDERYNVDLSYRRARSVVEYLASRGVARERLDYAGYGSRQPVAPNDSADGRALNRRVEFTILDEGGTPTERDAGARNPSGARRRERRRERDRSAAE